MNIEYDFIDGTKVPQTYIHDDYDLIGTHRGTINVEGGVFRLLGIIQGTLNINTTHSVEIIGEQKGTVSITQNGHVTVTGSIQGTTYIGQGATVIIEETGKLAGTISNYGTLIIRGVFGGAQSGTGKIIFEGSGYIKEPVIRDGVNYYEW